MPPEPKELVLGGQAVIEGVMMKGPLAYAVAVRKANGEIRVRDFPLVESAARKRIAKIPLVRGVVTMAAMLAIGYRALQYSADEAMEDAEGGPDAAKDAGEGAKPAGLAMAGAMAMALLLGDRPVLPAPAVRDPPPGRPGPRPCRGRSPSTWRTARSGSWSSSCTSSGSRG